MGMSNFSSKDNYNQTLETLITQRYTLYRRPLTTKRYNLASIRLDYQLSSYLFSRF